MSKIRNGGVLSIKNGVKHLIADVHEQADWAQENPLEKLFIKNKEHITPEINDIKNTLLNILTGDTTIIRELDTNIEEALRRISELETTKADKNEVNAAISSLTSELNLTISILRTEIEALRTNSTNNDNYLSSRIITLETVINVSWRMYRFM